MPVIGIGIWAFVVYLAVVIIWSTVIKRSMTEAMFLGLLVVTAFNGFGNYAQTLGAALKDAATQEVFVATMLFVMMAAIMTKTDIIPQLVTMLNSLIGRVKGGSAYVSTLGSGLFGVVCPNSVANPATIGTITIPWMIKSGWSPTNAAIINSGNSGSGLCYPASSCMFLLLALPQVVAAGVTIQHFYFTMLAVGTWMVLLRLLIVRYYVWKYHIKAVPQDENESVGKAFRENWPALLMFVSIVVPLILTLSPLASVLERSPFGKKGVASIHILVWVPALIILICLIHGRNRLPKTGRGWVKLFSDSWANMGTVGGIFFFAMSASSVLSQLGFGDALSTLVKSLALSKFVVVLVMAVATVLVAGPLSGLATTVAMGPVTFSVLTSFGIAPACAIAAFMVWMSTEGASPPASAAIYLSCALAGEEDVQKTFKPLIFHYVIPTIIAGVIIALGFLPIPL